MRKRMILLLGVAVCVTGLGCSRKVLTPLPTHDQVMIYERPYDYVYLRVIEAVQNTPNWEIYQTDHRMGIVRALSLNFNDPLNSDKRVATFIVRRLGRRTTSVSFAPESNQVIGGEALLKTIELHMSRPPFDGYRALRTNTPPTQTAERQAAAALEVSQTVPPALQAPAAGMAGAPPEIQAAMQKAQAQGQPAPGQVPAT